MKEALLKKHPELEGILNKLSSKSQKANESNELPSGSEGKPAAQVARDFW